MFRFIVYAAVGLALLALLGLASGAWTYITAPFFGRVQAEKQLESGPSRIAFYNRFHDLCAGVQALEGQITAQQALVDAMPSGSSENKHAMQNVAGLKARRAQLIAQYNADASKDYTAARFKDADLPWQLSVAAPSTTCAGH